LAQLDLKIRWQGVRYSVEADWFGGWLKNSRQGPKDREWEVEVGRWGGGMWDVEWKKPSERSN